MGGTTQDLTEDSPERARPGREAWRGRRVLITGHTGFKGAWLSLWLQGLGAEVTGYALESPTDPNLFDLAHVAEGMRSVRGDVRDLDRLLGVFRDAQPEVVFHLAAQSLVRPSYDQPVDTFSANVMGTVHVLEAVRRTAGVRAAIMVTSDKCYENQEWLWPYRESEPMGGHDPYSASKGCSELVTQAYRDSFFSGDDFRRANQGDNRPPAVASARAGNVVGGGDWATDRLIPDLVRSILAGKALHLRRPDAVRPWQHVVEALAGYLALGEHLLDGGPLGTGSDYVGAWNFGPSDDDARTVEWIVERLAERFEEEGQTVRWTVDPGPHPHEAGLLKLDASKARNLLGWRPRLDLGTALDWIVEWTQGYRMKSDLRGLTERQIARYESLG